jgi:hypothetical protein
MELESLDVETIGLNDFLVIAIEDGWKLRSVLGQID